MPNFATSIKNLFQHRISTGLVSLLVGFFYGLTFTVCFASLFVKATAALLLLGVWIGCFFALVLYRSNTGKQLTLTRYGESFEAFAFHFFSLWVGSAMFVCMALQTCAILGNANLIVSLVVGTFMALGLAVMPK